MNNNIIYVDFSIKSKNTTIKRRIKDFLISIFKNKDKINNNNIKGKLMIYDDFRHIL